MRKKKQILLTVLGTLVIGSGIWFVGGKVYEIMTAVKVQEKVEQVCHLSTINRIEFKGDELTTLEKQGDKWLNTDYPYLEYDQVAVNKWTESLLHEETTAIVKNVDNEANYGINEKSPMITLFDATGQYETFRVENVMNSENKIYIKKDGEEEIFVIAFDKASLFNVNPNTFVVCEGKLHFDPVDTVTFVNADKKEYTIYQDNGTWYLKDYYQVLCVLKEEAISDWIEKLQTMELTSYVTTSKELSAYGLEEPAYILTVNEEVSLRFGKKTDRIVYVAFDGENDVYTMDKKVFEQVVEAKFFDMMDKNVLHLSFDEITSVEVNNPQSSYILKINDQATHPTQEADKDLGANMATTQEESLVDHPTNTIPEAIPEAFINQQKLSRVEAEECFQLIQQSLVMEAVLQNPDIEQKEERKAECNMIFELNTGETITIELIPYDINYYILRYNGTTEVAVNKEKVTKLFTSLAQLESK